MFWIMIYIKVKNEMKSVCLLAIVLQRNQKCTICGGY